MRFFGYLWALPATVIVLSLAAAAVASGGRMRVRAGVVEAWGGVVGRILRGGRLNRGGAAMTLGHVILARNLECLLQSREHELLHVRQFERWGPFFLPAYLLVGAWLWFRGYHPYLGNPF